MPILHRTRSKKKAFSTYLSRFTDAVVGAVGLYCLYLAAAGLWTGEVLLFSKRIYAGVTWASDPLWFMAMVAAWVGGGIFLIRLFLDARREW